MANKKNVGECTPPEKKHRLFLSLKHKPFVPQQETRFAEPVSEYEVKQERMNPAEGGEGAYNCYLKRCVNLCRTNCTK